MHPMNTLKTIQLKPIERSIIIFLVSMLAAVFFGFFSKMIPWKTILSFPMSIVTPLGTIHKNNSNTAIAAKLAHIPKVITFSETNATTTIPLESSSYILINRDTQQILSEHNMNERVSIASVTKLLTAVVALDLAKPTDSFLISHKAASIIPTKIGVVPGQHMSLKELLYAMLLTSANDAAEVVKEGVNTEYGKDVFINAMNTKAALLHLKNSHFENPQGFDAPDHYSSAYDLAILTEYALTNYPMISQIVSQPYAFLPENADHKQFDLLNWNGLLDVYPGVSGVKIGNTDAAGKTTIVTATRNNSHVLAVVLGAKTLYDRDLQTASLLDWAFEQVANLPPVNLTHDDLQTKYLSWQTLPHDLSFAVR